MRFAPSATGARNASLNLTSDAPGRFTTVTLTGTGTAAPTGPAVRSHPRGILASLSAHRTLSVEQARHGIRVHAVLAAPGTVDLRSSGSAAAAPRRWPTPRRHAPSPER